MEVMDNKKGIKRLYKTDILVYLYAAILLLMNFIRIFDNSFWGDEYYSIRLARMNMKGLLQTTAGDVHPPLYYIFVKTLYKLLGDSGVIYHFSGFLPYALIIVISCIWVKKRLGVIPTFIMITMSSLMPIAVVENVEVRMYSMAAFFVLTAYIFLYEIINRNRLAEWMVFCLASLGAAYTHYYALISVAFFYIMLIFMSIKKAEYRRKTVAACITTVVGYLPWFFKLLSTFKRTSDNWWVNWIPTVGDCVRYLFKYRWLISTFFIMLLIFALYQQKVLEIKKNKKVNGYELVVKLKYSGKLDVGTEMIWVGAGLLSVFGTMLVGIGVSYAFRPLFQVRYCFQVSAVAYLVLGFCISKMNYRRIFSVIVTAALLISTLPDYISIYRTEKALNADTEILLNKVIPSSDALIYTNISSVGLFDYYYPQAHTAYGDGYIDTLQNQQSEVWVFWTEEVVFDQEMEKIGYSVTKFYEGSFPNGAYCYVYKISKED